MILQAYDFLELNRREGCLLQMGGSDQWGNIVNGIDLTRRVAGARGLRPDLAAAHHLRRRARWASPQGGAVWLNAEMLSPYDFWQFWRNTTDADVGRFLKLYTELPRRGMRPPRRPRRLRDQRREDPPRQRGDDALPRCRGGGRRRGDGARGLRAGRRRRRSADAHPRAGRGSGGRHRHRPAPRPRRPRGFGQGCAPADLRGRRPPRRRAADRRGPAARRRRPRRAAQALRRRASATRWCASPPDRRRQRGRAASSGCSSASRASILS